MAAAGEDGPRRGSSRDGGWRRGSRERWGLRGKRPLAYRRRELRETVVRIRVDVVFLTPMEAAVERIRFQSSRLGGFLIFSYRESAYKRKQMGPMSICVKQVKPKPAKDLSNGSVVFEKLI